MNATYDVTSGRQGLNTNHTSHLGLLLVTFGHFGRFKSISSAVKGWEFDSWVGKRVPSLIDEYDAVVIRVEELPAD
jgi:hypothetical protein